MIQRYGIPQSIFQRYTDNEETKHRRSAEIKDGLFKEVDNTVTIDYNAVVKYYSTEFCRPIAEQIAANLSSVGRDTRRNRIEFTMKFVQDIPYAVPDFDDSKWAYGGFLPPPMTLLCMAGDCDTKAILFVSILVHLINPRDVIFLMVPSTHVLTAVREESNGGVISINYKGGTYLLSETAGPGRMNLGNPGLFYYSQYQIEPVEVTSSDVGPVIEYGDQRAIVSKNENNNEYNRYGNQSTDNYVTKENRPYNGDSNSKTKINSNQSNEADDRQWQTGSSHSVLTDIAYPFFRIGIGASLLQGLIQDYLYKFQTVHYSYIATVSFALPFYKSRHYLGVFGTGGVYRPDALVDQMDLLKIKLSLKDNSAYYPFWEGEAGFLFYRWIRVSGGYGRQQIRTVDGSLHKYQYYTATAGVVLRFGDLSLDFNYGSQFGLDYGKPLRRFYGTINVYI